MLEDQQHPYGVVSAQGDPVSVPTAVNCCRAEACTASFASNPSSPNSYYFQKGLDAPGNNMPGSLVIFGSGSQVAARCNTDNNCAGFFYDALLKAGWLKSDTTSITPLTRPTGSCTGFYKKRWSGKWMEAAFVY